jgi:hypothetical protein
MYVSTAHVLRRFAQKMAQSPVNLDDPMHMSPEARAKFDASGAAGGAGGAVPVAPTELPDGTANGGFPSLSAKPSTATRIEQARQSGLATQKTPYSQIVRGGRQALEAGRDAAGRLGNTLYDNADVVGGGVLGAGALYALARAMQSEEDRKKRTPMLMPALGAIGGGVGLPMLMSMLAHNTATGNINNTSQAPAQAGGGLNPSNMGPSGPRSPVMPA